MNQKMDRKMNRIVSILLTLVLSFSLVVSVVPAKKAEAAMTFKVTVGKTLNPTDRDKILARVNEIRKEAVQEGIISSYVPAEWSADMEEIALQRAAEATLMWGHDRPNGEGTFAVKSSSGQTSSWEVIASSSEAIAAINQWYGEKANIGGTGETGHYYYLLNARYIGIASYGVTVGEGTSYAPSSSAQITPHGYKTMKVEITYDNASKIPVKIYEETATGYKSISDVLTVYYGRNKKLVARAGGWGSCDIQGYFISSVASINIQQDGTVASFGNETGTVMFSTGPLSATIPVQASTVQTKLEGGVLTLAGPGKIAKDYISQELPDSRNTITKIHIWYGVTEIGENAFSNMDSLKEVVLEGGVKSIGDHAFAYNSKLTTTTLPASVTYIGDEAFATGWYWTGTGIPVVSTKFVCPENSYAADYAKTNGISVSSSGSTAGDPNTSGSEINAVSEFNLSGSAHVQSYGDQNGTVKNNVLTLGTTGQGKRLEEITINFKNNTGYEGTMEYRVHRQTYGWTDWIPAGQKAGTRGESKRLEAIQIRLTGELAKHYSVMYEVHAQTYGWSQGWQYDGALAGTEAEAKRLESLKVKIVRKGSTQMGVEYRVHRQTYGWENAYRANGTTSGTTGQAKRLEGIELALTGNKYSGSIVYSTHVQSYGWMNEVSDGMMSGTTGKAKRLEAIKIRLTGEVAEHYDIYYRVHAQSYGWLGWAKNGAPSGTEGHAKRLEAIQVVLVPKGGSAPPNTYYGVTSDRTTAYVK